MNRREIDPEGKFSQTGYISVRAHKKAYGRNHPATKELRKITPWWKRWTA